MESKPPSTTVLFEIESTTPAPTGWRACYLISYNKATGEGRWKSLPIVLWATVLHADQKQEIRPFVAWASGEVLDYLDNEDPFLCLVAPDESPEKVVQAVIDLEGPRIFDEAAPRASTDLPS